MIDYQMKIQVGDEKILCVEGFGQKGNPFCKLNGFVIFINKYGSIIPKERDVLRVKITAIKNKFGFADIMALDEEDTNG
jgi:predicted RNA-binding protein with TRAM domain